MWHWLRSALFNDSILSLYSWKLSKRQIFLLQLSFLVLVGHICLVFLCIIFYQGYHEHERFNISLTKQSAVLVLAPLKKRIQQKPISQYQKNELQVTKVIDMQTYEKQKKLPKKQDLETKLTVEVKDIPVEVSKQKIEEKKSLKHTNVVKPVLQLAQTKNIVKEKKIESKQEKIIKNKEFQKKDKKQEEKVQEIDVEHAIFVGYEELDSITIQHKIQQQIQKCFKLPVGVSKNASCEVQVKVSKHGVVQEVVIIKSSKIMVYDVSARASVYHIEFPKEVWNKTITIAIGQ